MSKHFGVLVIGTACQDFTFNIGDIGGMVQGGLLAGKKTRPGSGENPRAFNIRAGGSAINTGLVIEPIANAMGLRTTVYKAMRLGRTEDNSGKQLILAELGNPGLHDKTLMDGMYGRNYSVPLNLVLENGNEDHWARAAFRNPPQNVELNPRIFESLDYAVHHSQIVMGNSSPAEETLHAFRRANQLGVATVLDYSQKIDADNPDRAEEERALVSAAELLPHADYLVAPHDAMLPGMKEPDADRLFEELAEKYGRKNFAISNGAEDVKIFADGARSHLNMHKVRVRNVNGGGDTRDAGLVVGLMSGYAFPKAVHFASDVAEFYVQQPTRAQFIEALPNHFNAEAYGGAHAEAKRGLRIPEWLGGAVPA